MPTTNADTINADLLAFLKEEISETKKQELMAPLDPGKRNRSVYAAIRTRRSRCS